MKMIAAAFTAALVLVACGGSPEEAPSSGPADIGSSSTSVEIANFAFSPKTVEVAVGETVRWVNNDDIAHTVTSGRAKKQGVPGVSEDRDASPDGVFDSGTMELSDTFEFTADKAGTYDYFCAIHAGMKGTLVVR